jgi:hypothetical protein
LGQAVVFVLHLVHNTAPGRRSAYGHQQSGHSKHHSRDIREM